MLRQDAAGYRRQFTAEAAANISQEVASLRRDELNNLARDAKLLPDSAPIQYRYGLALYLHDQRDKAETALKRAVELEPETAQFVFALSLFYQKYEQYELALSYADKLVRLQPDAQNYRDFRNELRTQAGQATNATEAAGGPSSR
jgi:tetratricopeptide (TPR) repeat protein